ncbi:MAG: tRNA threonylcarbamoyladenosine dehydratase [Bacteroidia bacterium]|nr:tRNA threonylcarbamoyladenosine dehydratase [Bacteroidia bacterium]
MDSKWDIRTKLLLGENAIEKLSKSHVLIVGLGGVGAYAAEMLCRAGIGTMTLVDGDTVQPSNRNRQLVALISTEGRAKTSILSERFYDINPYIKLNIFQEYLKGTRIKEILDINYDYVIDAIDSLSPKVFFIRQCLTNKLPIVSSMGAGGKLDPSQVLVADISESYNCALARMLRKRLHKFKIISGFKVVFSPEPAAGDIELTGNEQNKKSIIGTISYMPAVFGCFCASVVINDLIYNFSKG